MTATLTGTFALPESTEGWKVAGLTAGGLRRVTARRWGVTFIFVGRKASGWHVTKMHNGRIVAERGLVRLPAAWLSKVEP